MRIRMLTAALVSVLTGCASTAPVLPEVARPTVTTASVVVAAPCVTEIPPEPQWAGDGLPPNANEFQKARALAAEHLQRRQYVPQLLAILAACK